MKLKNLIFLGLLFSIVTLNAQTDFRPGYIIEAQNDTLFGEIDYRGDILMSTLCKFRNKENTITKYSPNDIVGFRFIDSKYYVSKEIDSTKVFLEYLIKGQINIYYIRDQNGDHYYLDKEGVALTEMPYKEETKFIDNKQVLYKSTKHIGVLNYYTQDAPEIKSQIESMGKPDHKKLIELAENYHNVVCNSYECTIFEKTLPLIKILPELVGGIIKYRNIDDLNENYFSHYGIITHIWMPRVNEKIFFRTGLLASSLNFNGRKKTYYRVPLQLGYIYPKGILRPRISYGLNLYSGDFKSISFDKSNLGTVSSEFGANIKLASNVFLSVTSEIEFNSVILVFPQSLLSSSLKMGLFLNLN